MAPFDTLSKEGVVKNPLESSLYLVCGANLSMGLSQQRE